MWIYILSLIEKKWTESRLPRKRLAKAILLLYSSLENCHLNYVEFKDKKTTESLERWTRSVRLLVDSFASVERTLQIFAVDLYTILALYSWEEFFRVRTFQDSQSASYIEINLRSYLASLEIATAITSHIAEEDLELPNMKNWMPLIGIGVDSTVRKLSSAPDDSEGTRRVFIFDTLLHRSSVNDAEIIKKLDKDLFDLDSLEFDLVLGKFRDWIRRELKIEEIFASV